jgi:hypothetical protein
MTSVQIVVPFSLGSLFRLGFGLAAAPTFLATGIGANA